MKNFLFSCKEIKNKQKFVGDLWEHAVNKNLKILKHLSTFISHTWNILRKWHPYIDRILTYIFAVT